MLRLTSCLMLLLGLLGLVVQDRGEARLVGHVGGVTSGGGSVPFVALHTYFMAPTTASPAGNDSNSGTSAAAPWASPNHALNCGDVIVAKAGTYGAGGFGSFGTVSNCPSVSGGIDGAGGVWFAVLLCGGTDLGTSGNGCFGNAGNASEHYFDITKSNWAVEGWTVTGGGANARAFEADACSALLHHILFVNDVAYNAAQAADSDDCGTGGAIGTDYWGVIGMIAQNAAQDSICLGAIDAVGMGVLNLTAGTHFISYGNFSYAHTNVGCRTMSDTECFLADTWDAHTAAYQGVWINNIGYDCDRMGLQLFSNGNVGATYHIYNNTFFQNNTHADHETGIDGEINMNQGTPYSDVTIIENNIAYQPLSSTTGNAGLAPVASALYVTATNLTNGASGKENIYRANQSSCGGTFCNSTFDNVSNGTSANLGTNTYVNPAFNNTTDLLANQVGAPNCAGFATTTACMGFNMNTQALANPSVIYDLQPTAGGTAGKGYLLQSMTCVSSGVISTDYPNWLKGVVYLHWNGSSLTENADLVTKPCGL